MHLYFLHDNFDLHDEKLAAVSNNDNLHMQVNHLAMNINSHHNDQYCVYMTCIIFLGCHDLNLYV